ncbi:SIR2 family protein [Pedobacter jamesrossensis]|uniref:SIR2 family protein n=1 Tax=Pedobacter jamesrossensis TaxID=1908238 RepID=A0ABV8NE79_9SPHI
MNEDNWKYILVNGKYKTVEVKNPVYERGRLVSIEDLRPFEKITEPDIDPILPTVEDANDMKRRLYNSFFRKPFKNFLILAAAGASIDVKGPSMINLWNIAEAKYKIFIGDEVKEDGFKIILDAVKYTSDKKDIEALLSQIEGTCKFTEDKKVTLDGQAKFLSDIKDEIFSIIKDNCSIPKPNADEVFPHKIFLEKLLQRKQTSPRVKVFTLNYDLLFEYAATEINAIVIDGFSFTFPRTFSGRFFDYDIVQREGSKLQEEDNFIQRVFHLHKLHGSLNWEKEAMNNHVIIRDSPERPLMVYPREAKYEDSYEQPFFEMMARFQRNLRLNNDTVLVSIGYSFNDKHINAAIEEALNQNPSFRLAVIDPGFDNEGVSNSLSIIKRLAIESERILMVSETFSDFASFFPEIKTYENDNYELINLKNEQSKD